MDKAGPPAVLPLRPLTVGELLDAGVSLLGAHARALLAVGVVLAAAEQALLATLRALLDVEGWSLWDNGLFGPIWLVLCVGAGCEAAAIALLGGLTSRAAAAAVLGDHLPARRLLNPKGGRFGVVLLLAAVAGGAVFVASLAGPLWAVPYALLGLIVPVAVVDRTGPLRALGRGITLACRAGLRAVWVRLLGYLGWLTLRLALGYSALALLDFVGPTHPRWSQLLASTVWAAVNAVAYPALACLDAVLHLEIRTRAEGLDILLGRAGRHGPLTAALLRVGS